MKRFFFTLFSLFSLALAAQTTPAPVDTSSAKKPVSIPQIVVKVPFGKLTAVGDLGIKINKVVDSRCPKNRTCVWAGNIIAEYSVFEKGKYVEDRKMTIGVTEEKSAFLNTLHYQLTAYSVLPYPDTSTAKIAQNDYVFNIVWKEIQN